MNPSSVDNKTQHIDCRFVEFGGASNQAKAMPIQPYIPTSPPASQGRHVSCKQHNGDYRSTLVTTASTAVLCESRLCYQLMLAMHQRGVIARVYYRQHAAHARLLYRVSVVVFCHRAHMGGTGYEKRKGAHNTVHSEARKQRDQNVCISSHPPSSPRLWYFLPADSQTTNHNHFLPVIVRYTSNTSPAG